MITCVIYSLIRSFQNNDLHHHNRTTNPTIDHYETCPAVLSLIVGTVDQREVDKACIFTNIVMYNLFRHRCPYFSTDVSL
jgi:hypothetical protein